MLRLPQLFIINLALDDVIRQIVHFFKRDIETNSKEGAT